METDEHTSRDDNLDKSPNHDEATTREKERPNIAVNETLMNINENMVKWQIYWLQYANRYYNDKRPPSGKQRPSISRGSLLNSTHEVEDASDENEMSDTAGPPNKRRRGEDELSPHTSDNDSINNIKILTKHRSQVSD